MSDFSSIFVNSHCVSKAQLLSYIRQTLDREEAYVVESHINDCQFCNDALDALMEADLSQTETDLLDAKSVMLQQIFPKPVMTASEEKAENRLIKRGKGDHLYRRLLVAASLLLLIGLGGFTVFSYIQSHKRELALAEKGKGTSGYDAKYSKSDEESNEIVRLQVEDTDTLRATADSKNNAVPPLHIPPAESKIEENRSADDEKVATKAVEVQSPTKMAPPVVTEKVAERSAPAAATDAVIEAAPGMENYARTGKEEKSRAENEKAVAKKKSAAGLKYDNNVQSNQMSYPRNSGNENAQKRSEEVAGQNQNADEADEKEMSLFEKGMENYNNKNYRKSISYFQKALKKASVNEREEIMYQLALAYENSGKTSKANELYATLSSSKKYGKRAEKKLKESAAEDAKKK